ncbi:MAG: hypothetical protein WBZ20_15775, partial [Nitrososphaeraceae archaeon]
VQSNNIAQCGSLTGQFGQTIDQQQAEICNNASRYQSFASTGLIVGIIMLALGIVLIMSTDRSTSSRNRSSETARWSRTSFTNGQGRA